jgi:hypothetical protein
VLKKDLFTIQPGKIEVCPHDDPNEEVDYEWQIVSYKAI